MTPTAPRPTASAPSSPRGAHQTPASRPAGLDMTRLRAVRGARADHAHLLARIEDHLDRHDGYVAVSGGKDSIAVAHLARQVDPAVPMVWFDSGLEYPETRPYLEQLATAWNANFHIITASPTLLELLVASGAWNHDAPTRDVPSIGHTVIDTPARLAHERFGPGELWGVRAAESRGRRIAFATNLRAETTLADVTGRSRTQQRADHGGVFTRLDGTTAYSPIWDWPTDRVWEYLAAHDLPINPVYDKLRALGAPDVALRVSHALDGARLELGRITWLRRGWPILYADLERELPRLREFV